ncbi:MAG TPA: serine hydrolase [Patescibacteria group bacterium]|nr:serine hydrolase [Patescibacteria group bacterium]
MKDFHKWIKKQRKNHKKLLVQIKHDAPHIVIPVFLCIVLVALTHLDLEVKKDIEKVRLRNDVPFSSEPLYPVLQKQFVPKISAHAALILDNDSQVIIFERNPSIRFSMASTTKIMTALVALSYYQDTDVITVYSSNAEGVNVGFAPFEKLYFKDMLYGLLLPSGNDAAYAIADNYPDGRDVFVTKMNQKAQELGLQDTHFADPAGLIDDQNFTTAHDLARLTSVAIQNPVFRHVTSTKKKTIHDITERRTYNVTNLNRLLGQNGVTGVKTGFTEGAGEVLVTTKLENGKTFVIVVMKSEDRFADTQALLSLITENVTYIDPLYTMLRNEQRQKR